MESLESMNKKNQIKKFNKTIIEDIQLIDQVSTRLSKKIKTTIEISPKTVQYYNNFIIWCNNLKGDILEQAGFFSTEVSYEEIAEKELTPEQMGNIILLRAGNSFYKRVLAEYAKNKIEELLDLLDERLDDLTEEEKDLYLYFDASDIEISGKEIKTVEDRVKESVKEKIKSSQMNIKVPMTERSQYQDIEEYIDAYIRIISDGNTKLKVKRIPKSIYDNIQQLFEKVQSLKDRGRITEEENTYYHGVLYRLGEYYVSVAEGQQIIIEEGLKGIKIDRDLFMINQFIAEAFYEARRLPEEKKKEEKPKLFIKR